MSHCADAALKSGVMNLWPDLLKSLHLPHSFIASWPHWGGLGQWRRYFSSSPLYSLHNRTELLILEGCASSLTLFLLLLSSDPPRTAKRAESREQRKGNETLIETNENIMKWRERSSLEDRARRGNKNQLLFLPYYRAWGTFGSLKHCLRCTVEAPSSLLWHSVCAATEEHELAGGNQTKGFKLVGRTKGLGGWKNEDVCNTSRFFSFVFALLF